GHANLLAIVDLIEHKSVTGIPQLDLSHIPGSCAPCILGKQVMTSIPKVREGCKSTRRLELVYIDLFGPVSIQSVRQTLHHVAIIDDFSSFPWGEDISEKSD
ncbi:hypothetical protein BDV98DRAFT_474166, partial [Pterulicium gracile]